MDNLQNTPNLSSEPLKSQAHRILVVRPDRLGDVILSTPVFKALKNHFPKSSITALVQPSIKPLLDGLSEVDEVLTYEPKGRHRGLDGFFTLMEELKERKFDISISLQSQVRLAAACFGVGIPVRIGPLSKIHSFVFYNRGSRQRRSLVEMHEADYNLGLLRKIGIRSVTRTIPTSVHVSDLAQKWADDFFAVRGLNEGPGCVVVHPGMGGSALNWPEEHYIDLVKLLLSDGVNTVLTGGPAEGALIERIVKHIEGSLFKGNSLGRGGLTTYVAKEGEGLEQLAAIFSRAKVVVAPSTGPLHLANALKIPTVSFFSPIRVQSAIRWGPYLSQEDQVSVLVPEVFCGQDRKCLGSECKYFLCMKSILPRQAVDEVRRHYARAVAADQGHTV